MLRECFPYMRCKETENEDSEYQFIFCKNSDFEAEFKVAVLALYCKTLCIKWKFLIFRGKLMMLACCLSQNWLCIQSLQS